MSGKYKQITTALLTCNNDVATDIGDIADLLASHYKTVNSGAVYTDRFKRQKLLYEMVQLDFTTKETRQTIIVGPMLAVWRVHRPNIVPYYTCMHSVDFYCLMGN